MKTTIDHLPEAKQQKLREITALFSAPREGAPIQMLILFGSHARGDWVEDPETGYKSDWDLMVVVETEEQVAEVVLRSGLERQVRTLIGETPLTLIVHDIKFLNREIRVGQYFFSDIINEGVMLFDSRRFNLAKPKALNAQERLQQAERNFANWFDSAGTFWRTSKFLRTQQRLKEAAFLLHQSTERYYHAASLVFTHYKERTHDIEKLGDKAAEWHPLLVGVLPKTEPEDKHLFDLLKKAYIDARYSMSYRITAEELATLQARILVLAERVRAACLEKIATICGPEAMRQDLPTPPQMSEPVLANLPPPPSDPAEFNGWAQNLAELSEQRGEARGREAGKQEGELIGEARGKQEALLLVLRARGVEIPSEVEQRILACKDAGILTTWLQRAASVNSAAELLAS